MVKQYKKRPVMISAIEWTGSNKEEVEEFITTPKLVRIISDELYIDTLEGVMKASVNDYIIRGVNGEFYPCKPDIFYKTYEEV